MTTIKVTCPDCGDIDLQPHNLELVEAPTWATYMFSCIECGESVRKPADGEIADLLSSAGVPTLVIPAEALEVRPGPVLTYDDMLDFALALRGEVRLDEVALPESLQSRGPRRRRRLRG